MSILTLNCGSSSVKYQVYSWDTGEVLSRGLVERIGTADSQVRHYARGKGRISIHRDCPDHRTAVRLITDLLLDQQTGVLAKLSDVDVIGHRMVHGGEHFAQSVIIDDKALEAFQNLSELAPLHNPPNLTGIAAAQEVFADIPHCAVMDTAWHQTMPSYAYIYSVPYQWYREYGVRRYGFHGTSFLYVAKRAAVLLGKDPFQTNLILLHIGNGASANAVKNGLSVDTSMGFTPLEGLVMGTRSGDHDPAIGFHVCRTENLDISEIEQILNKKSGVLGVTEAYTDRRDVVAAANKGEKQAQLALDIEAYRIKKYIGAYLAALGKVDAVVFTAGVGEMSPIIREKSLDGLAHLGIRLSLQKNLLSTTRNAETEISEKDSSVKIFVIPTDEELVMTEDSFALLQGTYDVHTQFTYSFQSQEYVNRERQEAFAVEAAQRPDLRSIVAR